jgi:hypothetical protein
MWLLNNEQGGRVIGGVINKFEKGVRPRQSNWFLLEVVLFLNIIAHAPGNAARKLRVLIF